MDSQDIRELVIETIEEILPPLISHLATKKDLALFEGRLDAIETKIDSLSSRLDNIDQRIKYLTSKLNEYVSQDEHVFDKDTSLKNNTIFRRKLQ